MSVLKEFQADLSKTSAYRTFRADQATRSLYATDASIYQLMPLAVTLPRTQEDLQTLVELSIKHNLPILPRGSGTSLAGQAIGEALIIDCSKYLNNIIEINPEALTATVEPGVILADLNKAAAQHGLMFGPDPASAERATMGGVIGNNATGAHSMLYGMTADNILSAEVILGDGSQINLQSHSLGYARQLMLQDTAEANLYQTVLNIRKNYSEAIKQNYPRSWRNSAGYRLNYLIPWSATQPSQWGRERYPDLDPNLINLTPLLAGSEGTLAVIRQATVKLVKKPKHTVLAVLAYESIAEACDDVPRLLTFQPSAVELVPQMLIKLARDVPAYARQIDFVDGDPAALLIVEFSGDSVESLMKQARLIKQKLRIVTEPEAQARVWNVRKVGLGIFDSQLAKARPIAFIEDCAIPVERLGEFVRSMENILAAHQTEAAFYAHASAGCLHIRPMIDLRTGQGLRQLRGIAEATLALTLQLGGAMASEHGDGLARSEWLLQTYGPAVLEAFKQIKQAADPHGLLNPKKILNAPRMDENLRFGTHYQSKVWQPALSFERAGGLAAAMEQCNGQGVCRKAGGVMCPSFQATREEMHSTRGRANLLRVMISAGENGLAPEQVKPALELCLGCKGCAGECPSGVDMPRLKAEFDHEFYKTHRRPLRDYLFANIGWFAWLINLLKLGDFINLLVGWRIAKLLINRLGISAHRDLALFGEPVKSDLAVNNTAVVENCLYLPDAFTSIFEPQVEQAAMQVLAACGIKVIKLPVLGAGRTLLSKGFIPQARQQALKLIKAIDELDPSGSLLIIGLEPSELYLMKDELQDLLPEQKEKIKALAERTWLADEYLIRAGRLARLTIKPAENKRVVLHGHCHQKAQPPAADGLAVGQAASAAFLQAVGYHVDILPSGCCGMSGSFGYEAEKYELSQQIGELVLFPALREAQDAFICAPGTSCRSQIKEGVGSASEHPFVLALQNMKEM